MTFFCTIITGTNRVLFVLAAAIIFSVVPMLLYEVVARYVFDAPTVWAMEASTLVFGPHFMLAGPYLLHLKYHVAVDILSANLTCWKRRAAEIFANTVVAAFAALLAAVSWPLATSSYGMAETSFSAWNPSIWWLKFIVPFAFVMLCAQAIVEIINVVRQPDAQNDVQKEHSA